MYADYAFYRQVFGGQAIAEADWPRRARPAERYIDRATFGRLAAGAPVTDAVRLAVCAAAEVFVAHEAASAAVPAGLTSANTDGYSESYADAGTLAAARDAALAAAVDLYLARSDPLRYCGVTPCWDAPRP